MSELPREPQPAPAPKPGGTSIVRILLITVALAAVAGVGFGVFYYQSKNVPPVDTMQAMKKAVTEVDRYSKLDPAYADANGDQIADEPTDRGEVRQPGRADLHRRGVR